MSAITDRVARLIRPEIRALRPYHVPDAAGLIKLDAMENPYVWPEPVKQEWLGRLREVAINRYPDPSARALRTALKKLLAVPRGMDLLLGNGSDELIQLILMGIARTSGTVLAPVPTFVMYDMIATFVGMKFVGVPLAADFGLDLDAMQTAIDVHQPAVIFLSYPNNPTGNLFDASSIEAILRAAPGLVVVDEAYYAFALQSFMDRLGRYDNLLVMRTLSKQGLAGLRLGMLAGDPAWLAEFDKLRLPYNINVLTQASAEFAVAQAPILDDQATQIRADRERLKLELERLAGVQVWPSAANFLLFRTAKPADLVFEQLCRRGVLIKNLAGAGGVLAGCLRVTIGTPAENAVFLEALAQVLNDH
ncbi:MAG: histidinol-phosphate transaminase [Acidiferrobacterales bacterium]